MNSMTENMDARKRRITFSLFADTAKNVYLAGDFNGWNPADYPMKKNRNGKWTRQLSLYPGEFEYKFLVDDRWVADPQNDMTCTNCYGTCNSVIQVTA